ncbi:MAG: hypothetical protein ABI934_07900 [Actinomycetota bacterium]
MPTRHRPMGANLAAEVAWTAVPQGSLNLLAAGPPSGLNLLAGGPPSGLNLLEGGPPSHLALLTDVAPVRTFAAAALAAVSLMTAAGVGSLFLGIARDAWVAIAAAGPASPADGILLVVALGGALLSLWLGAGVSLSALAGLPGALGQASGLVAAHIAPAAASRIVAVVLGTTMTAGLSPVAAVASTGFAPGATFFASSRVSFGGTTGPASDPGLQLVRTPEPAAEAAPTPSWLPDEPAAARRPASPTRVAIRPGDTLWSIAADQLGPRATSAQIDAEWHRWFAANRKVIGDDPNRIAPGQVLSPPETSSASS